MLAEYLAQTTRWIENFMHLPCSDTQLPICFSCWGVVKHSFIQIETNKVKKNIHTFSFVYVILMCFVLYLSKMILSKMCILYCLIKERSLHTLCPLFKNLVCFVVRISFSILFATFPTKSLNIAPWKISCSRRDEISSNVRI